MRKALLVSVVSLVPLFGATAAFGQEDRIRQADQISEVRGHVGQPLLFTTSGFGTDIVQVQLSNGVTFASGRIQDLMYSPFVVGVDFNSGGQISLRWCFPSPQASFNGGTVAITRGATFVDRDRIVLR